MIVRFERAADIDEMLAEPQKYVKRDGVNVTASVALPKDLLAAGGTIVAATHTDLGLAAAQRLAPADFAPDFEDLEAVA